jgi:UDP-hydrolysing UDP-N-acetyl-D-glucosamine 2-epimerase
MRTVLVVTTSRADFGIYEPVLMEFAKRADIEARLLVVGSHAIHGGAWLPPVMRRVSVIVGDDSAHAVAVRYAAVADGCADYFGSGIALPDLLLVLGDRWEMHAAAVAAVPFRIPIAHIHGGELTAGLYDDQWRHSLTKLAHLHFVSHPDYARRVIQMGEEPWRVTVCGAPALDGIEGIEQKTDGRIDLANRIGMPLDQPFIIATLHPETLDPDGTADLAGAFCAGIAAAGLPVIYTAPGADTAGSTILARIAAEVKTNPRARFCPSLGTDDYRALMARAAVMVGNSSSGIIEAPSFRLPVVNIGRRQDGRIKAANVICCVPMREAIAGAIEMALSREFCASIRNLRNPYYQGGAAKRIVEVLRTVPLDDRLIRKEFRDMPGVPA